MYPLFKPFMPDLPELNNILKSGKLSYGSYTLEFEKILREYLSEKNVLVTNSFSSAIDVVISCLDLRENDEVIMSPMACLASSMPYVAHGLKVIWSDIDPRKGTLDPESVEKKITKKTKLIVHNHFCGFPGYIDEINEIARKNNIIVIDDAIEAFGSTYKNKKIGNCGTDITIFSLSPVRLPNTIEGGIVVFNNNELFKKSLMIRDLSIDRKRFRKENGEINGDLDINHIGYSAMMSNINGYIGTEQMKFVDKLVYCQRKNAEKWKELLAYKKNVEFINTDNTNPNYWVFGLLVDNKDEVIKAFRLKGFYASSVHINNNIYSVFNNKEDLPGVKEFYNRFVAIPSGWWMENEIQKYK